MFKRMILKMITVLAYRQAVVAHSLVSHYGIYQFEEPKGLKEKRLWFHLKRRLKSLLFLPYV